jgi:YVTN family beta-propeller protein
MSVESRIGTEIAGYRIERLLGRGGMGVVYLAEHTRLRRKAALKILASDLALDEKFRRRFIRESELAASIDHPNIIQIYDAAETDGQLYIAMRYVEGVDLAALLDVEGALEFARTIWILSQVGNALDAAHMEGLVHRDVKPANILIAPGQERDHVFLSDFGLTKRGASESHLTASGEMLGTIDYMAPEQIEGKPTDGRADLYSLGCVAFECLTGRKPYARDSDAAVLWAHMTTPVPSVSDFRDVPEGADHVVARALAKAPDDRFSTCREFVTALQDELPETEGAMPAFVRARRRRRGLARVVWSWPGRLVAALLVVALGLGVFLFVNPSSTPIDLKAMANVLVALDPATGSIRKAFRVGAAPSAVAVVGSNVWVANKVDGGVQKVDPADGRVTAVGATTKPVAMAIGEGFAWVLGGSPTSIVYSFPLATGSNGAPIDLLTNSEDIAAGLGSVWATDLNHRELLKIDPQSHEVVTRIKTDGIPTGVAVDTRSVWATVDGGAKDELLRIDPESAAITRIQLTMRANSVAAGADGVWVTNGDDDSVTRIDPATNQVKNTVAVGQEPIDVALGEGAVWVADQQGQRVSRVDPGTGRATTTGPMGLYPSGVAVGAGGVWVTANTNVFPITFRSAGSCPDEIPVDSTVMCADFTVPERHTDPGGRAIQIWLAKIPTTTANPPRDPVVVVGADLGEHPDYAGSSPLPARTGRDVYNVDLRGVGNSTPSLACPEVEHVKATIMGLRLRTPGARADFLDALMRCRNRLVSRGIDLGAYNIKEAAADMEDLRRALGFPQWNLRALGYSSRITFEVMRDFPSGVRAAWFDSPEYPQDNFFDEAIPGTRGALTELANVCQSDTACNKHFPDVPGAFSHAVANLNAHPVSVTVRDRELTGGKPASVVIDGDVLVRQVRQDLTVGAIPLLPAHIYAASLRRIGSGPDSMAASLLAAPTLCSGFRARCRLPLTFSLGTALSMLCHDEAPFAKAQPTASDPIYGEDFNQSPYLAACSVWNVGTAPASTHTVLNSAIPVLIFHGQFDPYYPYSTAPTGSQALRRNFLYEGTGLGYNVLGGNDCLLGIRNQWINDPTKAPDVSCLGNLPKTAGFQLQVGSY